MSIQNTLYYPYMKQSTKLRRKLPEATIAEVFEVVTFIKDNAATKDDIVELKKEIRRLDIKIDTVKEDLEEKINSVRNEVLDHVDGFIGIAKKQEQEFSVLVARHDRLEKKVEKITTR